MFATSAEVSATVNLLFVASVAVTLSTVEGESLTALYVYPFNLTASPILYDVLIDQSPWYVKFSLNKSQSV